MDSGPIVICDNNLYVNKSIDYYPKVFDSHDDDNHERKDKLKTSNKKAAVAPSNNEGYFNYVDYEDDNQRITLKLAIQKHRLNLIMKVTSMMSNKLRCLNFTRLEFFLLQQMF